MRILVQDEYKPGDLPPDGYLAWHEWAEVQYNAGIKQVECGQCGKWKTPQELSSNTVTHNFLDKFGKKVKVVDPLCLKCDDS